MALGTLTPSLPTVAQPGALVVTANAAQVRWDHYTAEAARVRRVDAGLEKPTEADALNLTFHLSYTLLAKSYEDQAALWATRAIREAIRSNYGRSQTVSETERTGVKLTAGYRRGEDGKGRQ
jgi:hypothetical protein